MENETPLSIYEVGMGTNKIKVQAPSAGAAAVYYGVCAFEAERTNNPFMAVVYTENGQEWEGDMFWISLKPDIQHFEVVVAKIGAEAIRQCSIIEPESEEA